MPDEVQTSVVTSSQVLGGGGNIDGLTSSSRRRRAPHTCEQERRVAWGKEWGALNSDHAKRIRERER